MVGLGDFARRIRRRARQVEEEVDRTVVLTAGVVSQAVISATPVDTGRARNNWQASIGTPIRAVLEETDQDGGGAAARNEAVFGTRRTGQTIFISNNVEYIEFLNRGSSAQAPANFVEAAVQTAVRFIRRRRLLR